LGLSEVGPRVAAAFGHLSPMPHMPAPAPSGGGGFHIDKIEVGSRDDIPTVGHEMRRVAFLVSAGSS